MFSFILNLFFYQFNGLTQKGGIGRYTVAPTHKHTLIYIHISSKLSGEEGVENN